MAIGLIMLEQDGAQLAYKKFSWLEQFCRDLAPELSDNKDSECFNTGLTAWKKAQEILGVDAYTLAGMVSKYFDLKTAKLPSQVGGELMHYIPRRVADQYLVFPLDYKDGKLFVASPHPSDQEMLSMLGFLSSHHIEPRIASPSLIAEWIEQYYPDDAVSQDNVIIKASEAYANAADHDHLAADSAIVEIVSEMLLEAFSMKASDIHIEPYKQGGIIRYRVDGLLRVITELPMQVFVPIVQRIKAISRLNLAKKMVPQDGSVSLEIQNQEVDLRVSTLPVKGGEKVVIRLLIKSIVGSLEEVGLQKRELQAFKQLVQSNEGIFVITGPTGSGKTSTLYAALKELNTHDRCLVTVEDPVEYEIDGIAQVSINPAQNLTFSGALRSILRQDPDVILMGEVRDEETAEMTFRAAITGHFVMTTLHTNDAITTIPRLLGLGVPATIVADSLRGVAAQRLVRKLCKHCAKNGPLQNDLCGKRFKTVFPKIAIKSAVGCEHCNQTGYKGRMPLFEIITMNDELADAIRSGESSMSLRKVAADSGSRPMYKVAIDAVSNGQTSADEIHRVLGESFWKEL